MPTATSWFARADAEAHSAAGSPAMSSYHFLAFTVAASSHIAPSLCLARDVGDIEASQTLSPSPTHRPPTTSSLLHSRHGFDILLSKLLSSHTAVPITKPTPPPTMADWQTGGDRGDGVAVPHDASNHHHESSAFDTTALAGALNQVDEAAFKDKAQEAGWVGTIPVNYNLQQTNREDELAAYAASSAVYEWNDEYGDVGPEVPQLEEQLFNNAFRLRQGKHMANLQLEVTVEGPDKIHPVRSVSSHYFSRQIELH